MPIDVPTLPQTAAHSGAEPEAVVDAVVVGLHPPAADAADGTGPALAASAAGVDTAFSGELLELLTTVGATGKAEQVVSLPTRGALSAPRLVAVGLGRPAEGPKASEAVRRAAGAAARTLAGTGSVLSTLSALDAEAAVVGAVLGGHRFDRHRTSTDAAAVPVGSWSFTGADDAAVRRATLVAEAVATARDLVNTAPNVLVPETFAAHAVALGEHTAQVIDVSGHTNGHIAFHLPADGIAFVGDSVFALGCGRM